MWGQYMTYTVFALLVIVTTDNMYIFFVKAFYFRVLLFSRLPQELSRVLSKWLQNRRCVLGLPWWRRTFSSAVWHDNWWWRMDHLSKAHGWLRRLLCRLGIIQKRLWKSGGRVLARKRLSSPSDCICQHGVSNWYGGLRRRPTICRVHDFRCGRRKRRLSVDDRRVSRHRRQRIGTISQKWYQVCYSHFSFLCHV